MRRVLASAARIEECGGMPCDGAPGPRLVTVCSTPCGGTTYTTRALQHAGYDVGHHHMHADGIVCGWALFGWRGPDVADHVFEVWVRQVRHPLLTLETLPIYANRMKRAKRGEPELPEILPPWYDEDRIVSALRFWVALHEHPQLEGALLLRLGAHFDEDWRRLIAELAERKGIAPVYDRPDTLFRRQKYRRWHRRTWDDLMRLDPEYTERARALVRRFDLEVGDSR